MVQIKEVELTDKSSNKRPRTSIAELTRPARAITQRMKEKTRKPQGRKRKIPIRPAKYHNWQTPFVGRQILQAGKQVGWKMSPTDIIAVLQKKDPEVFAGLKRTTVSGWIERSGSRPQWKGSFLLRIEQGDQPGHNKGGQRGVLVRLRHNT